MTSPCRQRFFYAFHPSKIRSFGKGSQNALRFWNEVAYDDVYKGLVLDPEACGKVLPQSDRLDPTSPGGARKCRTLA